MDAASDSETYTVALSFEDGATRFITCRADQTVADASYRQRINIPLDCRDGACGTCKALCESGDYDGGSYIDDALPPDEAAAGYVLPCSMRPRSDLVLQIASSADVAATRSATYTGTLVRLDRLSETTLAVAVEIPNRSELVFLPGQYVNISVPGTNQSRSYSFANAPDDRQLTFLVKLTPGGAMSEYLATRATVGDSVSFTGPSGSFFLRDTERPVLLVAGGTGLAPVLSMLRSMRTSSSTREAHLIYGVSTDEDLVAIDEIEAIAADLDKFTWQHCVSDPQSTAPHKGRVTGLITPSQLHDGDAAIYLCGPSAMVEAVRAHVAQAGLEPTGFYYEKFALARAGAASQSPAQMTPSAEQRLVITDDARGVVGQVLHRHADLNARGVSGKSDNAVDDQLAIRSLAGQLMTPTSGASTHANLDSDDGALIVTGARHLAGRKLFTRSDTTTGAAASVSPTIAEDGYQIGEEHPEVHASDSLFEARQALELGALELTLGRLTSPQLSGYRLLAESTLPYVRDEHFVDAAQYTETNAAFHDYLFTLTGNKHLLQAYQALGVKARMSEALRNATWCHRLCAQDHVDIVAAFEAGDRDAARTLIIAHAGRSKQTMRRAMSDAENASKPRFVTPGRFAGKVVVVTGAAQGIGAHTARRIGAEGGVLVLVDRSELVKELADELSAHRDQVLAVTTDLEHFHGAQSLCQQTLSAFGRIDVLINNVGGAINFKPFTEFTDSEIRAEIDRSLMTTMYTCRAALPSMVERGRGVIVNVSSAATKGIHRIPYSAAKGGINAITASLAMEYAADGIRVVATAPGGTAAPIRRISRGTPEPQTGPERAWFDAHIEQTIESSMLKRYGTLDEQAAAICFVASDEASYITGTVLPVAGGDTG